jgi:hypothetical protein
VILGGYIDLLNETEGTKEEKLDLIRAGIGGAKCDSIYVWRMMCFPKNQI